ncbi:MAG: hypothetical protein WCO56_21980 [Verrucomicrobiota bacterium]
MMQGTTTPDAARGAGDDRLREQTPHDREANSKLSIINLQFTIFPHHSRFSPRPAFPLPFTPALEAVTRWLLSYLAISWLFTGCASRPSPAGDSPIVAPAPYLRVQRTHDGVVALQVVARQFCDPHRQGAVVWLVGVAHVGDTNYFAALQQFLDQQPLVLFEGIGGRPAKSEGGRETDDSLQTVMADSLGLVFQLEAIDYARAHFKNSDLTVPQLQRVIQETGSAEALQEFDNLLSLMQGGTLTSALLNVGMRWIGGNPHARAMMRLALIETLGSVEGDLSNTKGLPPGMQQLMRALIRERNKVVLLDLQGALASRAPPKSVAIFYGAAHMDDLEQRLMNELHYQPVKDQWFCAFSVNPDQAGLSPAEINLVRLITGSFDLGSPR